MSNHSPVEHRTIEDYLAAIASTEPMPGGGSVAGVVASLGASLGQMVVSLTRDADSSLADACDKLGDLKRSALASSDADEAAYNGFLSALELPKSTPEERARRRELMQGALQESAAVPMQLAETATSMVDALEPIIAAGNKSLLPDAAAAITLALASVDISLRNVRENASMIKDEAISGSLRGKAQKLEERARSRAEELLKAIDAQHGK